jgi:hypothetical protein
VIGAGLQVCGQGGDDFSVAEARNSQLIALKQDRRGGAAFLQARAFDGDGL